MKFNIKCEMEDRWVPHFLAMLKYMEYIGTIGRSRKVGIYSDGDGDFRPKFKMPRKLTNLHKDIHPIKDINGNRLYDAG